MEQLLLLAAVICFGAAVLKFAGNRFRTAEHRDAAPAKNREPWRTVPIQEAAPLLAAENAVILDVRTQEEFDQGHLAGAVCLPVETLTDGDLTVLLPDKHAPLVVYCRTGHRSAEAAQILSELGYEDITDLARRHPGLGRGDRHRLRTPQRTGFVRAAHTVNAARAKSASGVAIAVTGPAGPDSGR